MKTKDDAILRSGRKSALLVRPLYLVCVRYLVGRTTGPTSTEELASDLRMPPALAESVCCLLERRGLISRSGYGWSATTEALQVVDEISSSIAKNASGKRTAQAEIVKLLKLFRSDRKKHLLRPQRSSRLPFRAGRHRLRTGGATKTVAMRIFIRGEGRTAHGALGALLNSGIQAPLNKTDFLHAKVLTKGCDLSKQDRDIARFCKTGYR
jgi:hypothetical protein